LLGDRLLPYEVEDVIGPLRKQITDGLYRLRLCGIDDIGGTKSSGLFESLLLDVDDDYSRCTGDARPTNSIEPDPSCTEDHDCVTGANVRSIQDRAGTRYYAAAEERSLGERKLLGYEGKLVFMDESLFGEAAQPEALEQANPIAAKARGIGRSAHRRLGMFALEGSPR
jgi:hypothetical protein